MRRVAYMTIAGLALLSGYLGYRTLDLEKQLYRAEYFAQSGLLSAQRACTPVVDMLYRAERMTAELQDLARGCFGQYEGDAEAKEYQAAFSSSDPRLLAELIERRLKKDKRLPWESVDSVDRELLPKQYVEGGLVH